MNTTAETLIKPSKMPLSPESAEPEKFLPVVATWIYRPNYENSTAPFCFQFPPDNVDAIKALASNTLAMSNADLPMEQLWVYEGMNTIPISVVRALQSHPTSADVLERKVLRGAIEILDMDFADIDGVSTDTAMSIHYTPVKAIRLINACFDVEELKRWKGREIGNDRKEVRLAIDRRTKALTEEESNQIKAEQANSRNNSGE